MGQIIASTYEILREIGSGGGGTVYLAQHLRLGKQVVLKADKRRLKTPLEDLRREVDILKNLHHPYIPQVYDFLVEDDTVYTVMDYIEGESFDRLLRRGTRFTQPQLVQWMIQLLRALDYLHTRPPHGILHGDIKPANIMLTPEGDIRLIDFNIALNLGEEGAVAVGRSFGYASPEHYGLDYSAPRSRGHTGATTVIPSAQTQLGNETVCSSQPSSSGSTTARRTILLSPRSDIYSLGATLYHLMTGVRPAKDALEVAPIDTGAYHPALAAIIRKAMQPDQTQRYQTAQEMLRDVQRLWDADARLVRLKRTRRALAGVLGALFLLGAAGSLTGFVRMQKIQAARDAAANAERQLAAGEPDGALQTALDAIPASTGLLSPPVQPEVQKALTDALGLYDLSGGLKLTHTVTLPTEALKLALSPDRKTGAALSLGTATLFSAESGQQIAVLDTVDSAQADFAFLDDDTFAYAGRDGLSVYRISEQRVLWTGEPCEKLAVSANGASLAAASLTAGHAVVYTPDGQVRRQIDFAGRDLETVSNGRFADPKDLLFCLNAAGDLLAVSFSDGSLELYDVIAQDDLEILEPGGYTHFEGGFYRQYFAFSATGDDSLFAVVDTQALEQTGGFTLTSRIGVQADETGVFLSNEYTLVQIDPVTGEQREMAFTNSVITDFWRSPEHTLVMTQDAGVFLFDRNAIEEPYDVLHQRENCYAVLWDGGMALASLDSPVVQLLHFTDGGGELLFRYDRSYAHDEARVNAAQTAVMLYSYRGFRLVDAAGRVLCETELPDAAHVYDQQYYRDEQGSRLEVIYEDGHVDIYSGDTGEKVGTRQEPAPDASLAESFETARYRIESPLHGTPQVYDRESGKLIGTLERDAYLTYVTQSGDYLVTEYLSEDGTRWGLLLDGDLHPLAELPQLCDVTEDGWLLFDDRMGTLRQCRIYSINEIQTIAKQKLEEK